MLLKRILLGLLILAASGGTGAVKKIEPGENPPEKLSDLYKVLTLNMRKGLNCDDLVVWPIKLTGRSSEIMLNGIFYEVEMTLKPFETQGLSFEKSEIYVKRLSVDKDALAHWELKVTDYREVQTKLVFTLHSLEKKLGAGRTELKLRADSSERLIEMRGRGHFCGFPAGYQARASLRWDEKEKKLYLEPKDLSWAGFQMPRIFWWLGTQAVPEEPILDFSSSWIPLNIQELYVGWDRISLSTNW
jgi:hypothetical protein